MSPHVYPDISSGSFSFSDEVLEQAPADNLPVTTESPATASSPSALRPSRHAAPHSVEMDTDLRALDRLLAKMMHRASATIARSHLYFSDENLRGLRSEPSEVTGIADEIENKARELLLRAEVPHAKKYLMWSAQLRAAALAAERAAQLFDLLQRDQSLAASRVAPLRRVGDAAQRVLLYTATTLETGEARSLVSVARYQAELWEACARAMETPDRARALQPLPAERMTHAALWSLLVTTDCAAIVAQQYTEIQVERRVREAHRAHTAAKYSAATSRKTLSPLPTEDRPPTAWARPTGEAAPAGAADRPAETALLRPTPPPSAIPSPTPLMRRVAPLRRDDETPESRRSNAGAPTERAANTKVRRGLAAVARLFTR